MPGLSQLIQFNKDILSLGDEVQLRGQRGEKPVRVPVPKNIPDTDDSEDFVMGMPEIEAIVQDTSVDDDLSDLQAITGASSPQTQDNSSENSEEAGGFDAPDMSSLLAPMPSTDSFGQDTDMPDLSMFEEQPEEEIIQEEPKETSIADLSLEDLLGGAGFDGSSAPAVEETTTSTSDDDDAEFYSGGFGDENYVPHKKDKPAPNLAAELADLGISEIPELEDIGSNNDTSTVGDALPLDDLLGDTPIEDLDVEDLSEPEELGVEDLSTEDLGEAEDLGIETLEEPEELALEDLDAPEALDTDALLETEEPFAPEEITQTDDLSLPEDLSLQDDIPSIDSSDTSESQQSGPDFNLDDMDSLDGFDMPEDLSFDSQNDTQNQTDTSATDSDTDFSAESSLLSGDLFDIPEEETNTSNFDAEIPSMDDFSAEPLESDNGLSALDDIPSMDDLSLEESPSQGTGMDFSESPELNEGFGSDFGAADGLDALDSFDASLDSSLDSPSSDFDIPSTESEESSPNEDLSGGLPDFNLDDMDSSIPADSFTESIEESSIPADFMADIPDDSGSASSEESGENEDFFETFDTSEMDGMNFDVPETDSQLGGGDSGFELGSDQDFSIEGQDFTIPGFSDVETAKEEKRGSVLLNKQQSSNAEEELPPNTLSDAQYKVFLKNLGEYPLNVRLAFEDLIVKNEFTDEAEFEIVEKILNKAPARQVASLLEKMLDISIPVPRNFEHRTAEEYEAYKKSLQYQLKNKIIPALFACFVILIVGYGLFKFTVNCIYTPLMANHLYKEGYAMLEADEYPQSEIRFNEACSYRLNKKWFFKYARGYRDHKQYIRAEWMYQNILDRFKHDKTAGLEYANMELNDLANYEKAEDICRRQVLDFHINDADGILLLGDIFLEWGTEKDPSKLEAAREQYASLIQLYKSNYLYQSRMMRYFIRTDNLPEVLTLKEFFLPKEKNLSAEDWTELSGYMLDKLYGPLAPSDEYLRTYIEDVRLLLTRAVKLDPKNPIAAYNLSRYFIETNENEAAKVTLNTALENFNNSKQLHRRDLYKYIDTYRLAGEEYAKVNEYLRAQEYYTDGITLYTAERDASGLEGNQKIGQLFADQADMDYFITGDYDNALQNYISSVDLENDNSSIRYKIGYIQYKKKNYAEALGSFIKAGDGNIKETNLMLAMGNTLSLRGDNYAAKAYYDDLISHLDEQIADRGIVLPQTSQEENELVTTYLYASNNYGVTLYRLASRTGNSAFNAEAIVHLSQSVRAWDALTRNQETLVRLGGSNLAEENIKYITHAVPDFEPAIYTEIPRTIVNNEKISY